MLADTSMAVVLGMLFLNFSNTDIQFVIEKFIWRSYTTVETLLITRQIKPIDKYQFARKALDQNFIIFIIYISALGAPEPALHPSWAPLLATL